MTGSVDMDATDQSDTPERAGRYEFVELLGDSSLGVLWKARVTSGDEAGRLVVARRISRQGLVEDDMRRLTEAGFAAMEVRHPRIAAMLEVHISESEIAFISEYVEGVRLQTLLSGLDEPPHYPSDIALRVALDLLETLTAIAPRWREITGGGDALVENAIVGGLHPDAVVLTTYGEALITDVGITGVARSIAALSVSSPSVLPAGGPGGMPASGADAYTLGLLLRSLISPDADPSADVSRFIERAVSKDSLDRFESTEAMFASMQSLEPGSVTDHDTVARFVGRVVGSMSGPISVRGIHLRESDPFASNRPTVPPEGTPALGVARPLAASDILEPALRDAQQALSFSDNWMDRTTPEVPRVDLFDAVGRRSEHEVETHSTKVDRPPLERARRGPALAFAIGLSAVVGALVAVLVMRSASSRMPTTATASARPSPASSQSANPQIVKQSAQAMARRTGAEVTAAAAVERSDSGAGQTNDYGAESPKPVSDVERDSVTKLDGSRSSDRADKPAAAASFRTGVVSRPASSQAERPGTEAEQVPEEPFLPPGL